MKTNDYSKIYAEFFFKFKFQIRVWEITGLHFSAFETH